MVQKKDNDLLDNSYNDWSQFLDYDAAKKLSRMYLDKKKDEGNINLDLYKDRATFDKSLKDDTNDIDFEYQSKLRGVETESQKDLNLQSFNLAEKAKRRDRQSASNLYQRGKPL